MRGPKHLAWRCLGVEVKGLRLRDQGSEFRVGSAASWICIVPGLGVQVQGLSFSVQGGGFRVWGRRV